MIACNLLFVINISSFHCCDLEVITSRCKIGCHWLFRLQRLKKIYCSCIMENASFFLSYLLAINKENFRKKRPCVSSSFIIFAVGCINLTFRGNMRQ